MPAIIINDYTWKQTPESVIITTRLVGNPKKVDLFAIDNYMKASYPPFILELFLWSKILESESECTIGDDAIVFTLKKEENGLEWPCLVIEDLDKDKKRAHRTQALEQARVNAEKRAKVRSEKRQSLEKQAVREQIDLDTKTLNKIEATRDHHRKEAMRELEDWRNRAEKPILENIVGEIQENRKAYRAPLKWFKDENKDKISEEETTDLKAYNSESQEAENNEKKNGSIKNNYEESSMSNSDNLANEDIDKIIVSSTKDKSIEDKPSTLLSDRNNRDSISVLDRSFSSGSSSDSDTDSMESLNNVTKNSNIEETNEISLRKYKRRKEKENFNRSKELVRRLLNGKTGCVAKRSGRIFEEPTIPTPRPRRCGTIDVTFSERQFPTPARESHRLEEQEWLEKQAEARRKCGFVSEDLSAEEQDPLWLKDKGDEFFKAGNYLGAISAYTHGIKLSDKMASLYVNRSAAHYASENYRRCAEDCSRALELMVPKCEGNRDSRARCHARLGAALCKLSAPQHGIPELEAALKLSPENETIKRDLVSAKKYFKLEN